MRLEEQTPEEEDTVQTDLGMIRGEVFGTHRAFKVRQFLLD